MRRRNIFCLLLLLLSCHPATTRAGLRFQVSYPKAAFAGPFTGRIVIYVAQATREPRLGPNWFAPEPMYARDVAQIKPGDNVMLDDTAISFPAKPSALQAGRYTVQAVFDRNLGGRTIGASPGNLYSLPRNIKLEGAADQTVEITCDQVVPAATFRDTESVKGVAHLSSLLTQFYGRPTHLNAAVALPKEYFTEPERRFPIVYIVPGFGGRHLNWSGRSDLPETHRNGEPFLAVMLDPECPGGHSVFADSANNGPWGRALTTELIPAIEKQFRALGTMESRFVTGHSSGGWSSLWLQVTYPEVFGGCWSTAPDPVDFRDFQGIPLYQPDTNMFTDSARKPRPLARRGTAPVIFYQQFSDMERPLRGEQLGSFEAVFSPRGQDGRPLTLWNRDTGAIDPKVAKAWQQYDIGLILRTNWQQLKPRLRGKLHVYAADTDTFYLEGAVKLLAEDLKRLQSDAKIEILPGDHRTVLTPALRARIDQEMAEQFRRARPHTQK